MQSGLARTKKWILEYEPESPRAVEPLMGWTSSDDMKSQIRLAFAAKEEAIAYAKRNGIPYRVDEPKPRKQTADDNPQQNRDNQHAQEPVNSHVSSPRHRTGTPTRLL